MKSVPQSDSSYETFAGPVADWQARLTAGLKQLHADGKLTPPQEFLCAPTMPDEELYDLLTDPHQIHNLANVPENEATLIRLRSVLEHWISETRDQGRVPEPAEVAARKGATKPGTVP